jgi:hypothetical protein
VKYKSYLLNYIAIGDVYFTYADLK